MSPFPMRPDGFSSETLELLDTALTDMWRCSCTAHLAAIRASRDTPGHAGAPVDPEPTAQPKRAAVANRTSRSSAAPHRSQH